MPDVIITIGGREFAVSCQEGEEHYLHAAAAMLDTEASTLSAQIGRLPEVRMLLMAGLMLADKAAGIEDQSKMHEARIAELEAQVRQLENRAPPEPERIEVPVIPETVTHTLAELAARAEALAAKVEEKLPASAAD